MGDTSWQILSGLRSAIDQPVVVLVLELMVAGLLGAPVLRLVVGRVWPIDPNLRAELDARYLSWLIMVPAVVVPVLLGRTATIVGVAALSLLCYREFARATGLFRQKTMSVLVVLGILAVTFAVADRWYRLFVALAPLTLAVITAVATSLDHPTGFIQRVGLAVFGFLLFGICLGHLGYLANDPRFRSLILFLVFSVQLNDFMAHGVSKLAGGPRLLPRTSPRETVAGALGALLVTTAVVFVLTGMMFRSGPLSGVVQRVALGVLISIAGRFGDLSVAAIHRDVGLKDDAGLRAGLGSVLDRANSLLLAVPAVFHYINYLDGLGSTETTRALLGGG